MTDAFIQGTPYFSDTQIRPAQYPYLDKNLSTDVLIVGGGIDGALMLYALAKRGVPCALVEKKRIGFCCTSAATALLEYQLDDFAHDLKGALSEDDIVKWYRLGLSAIEELQQIVATEGIECEFEKKPTLIYGLEDKDKENIQKEYIFRSRHGFSVDLLDEAGNPYPFPLKAGLYSSDGGADLNPYLLAMGLLKASKKYGAKIYENTEAKKLVFTGGGVSAECDYGCTVKCKKVVCATGYDTSLFTKQKLCDKFVTYSLATAPISGMSWYNNALLQDTLDPYHYIKKTADDRIVIGGEDVKIDKGFRPSVAKKKYALLEAYLRALMPIYADNISVDYKFCGAFSSTKDNLGVFGPSLENPDIWYQLGYGANGILYSTTAARMLSELYVTGNTSDLSLFSPDRKNLL